MARIQPAARPVSRAISGASSAARKRREQQQDGEGVEIEGQAPPSGDSARRVSGGGGIARYVNGG